jgi:hypothetical protein
MLLYGFLLYDSRLLALYLELPFGRAFRFPSRFLWVVSFALSVLVGLGAEAVGDVRSTSKPVRLLPLALLALAGVAFSLAVPPLHRQWGLFAALAGAAAWIALVPARSSWARAALPVCVLLGSYFGAAIPFHRFEKDDATLTRYAAAFEAVQGMMTPQDRIFQYDAVPALSMGPKSASIFGVPSITDYEPLTSQRYADLWVRLIFDSESSSSNMFSATSGRPLRNRPLMNLLATRYVVSGPDGPPVEQWLRPPRKLVWEGDGVRIFENPWALPRAYYVPSVEVVENPGDRLDRLASPSNRPGQAALVERMPADGFVGVAGLPRPWSNVEIEADHGETIRLKVAAQRPGFLVLTDQDYPGWEATVAGRPTPILRANHAFRAVHVPAGTSIVEFQYRPRSVWLGAQITCGALAALALAACVNLGLRLRSRRDGARAAPRARAGSAGGWHAL